MPLYLAIPQLGELIGDVKKGYLNLITEEQKVSALKVCYKTLMLSNNEVVTLFWSRGILLHRYITADIESCSQFGGRLPKRQSRRVPNGKACPFS